MPSSVRRFGEIVKAFRQEARLTQAELASALGGRINRSRVAHLEQGIRLPSVRQLEAICHRLSIPESLWRSFAQTLVARDSRRSLSASLPFCVVAVAGVSGSGKSTLARQLARALNFGYVAESPLGKKYLKDLAADPARWAFDTQMAFLAGKALQLMEAVDSQRSVVVDRSLSEDVDVYARHFAGTGLFDARSAEAYTLIAQHFLSSLPPPDVVIYCLCSQEVAALRVIERDRGDTSHHTPEFASAIWAQYQTWLQRQQSEPHLYYLNTEEHDVRETQVAEDVALDVLGLVTNLVDEALQLTLFEEAAPIGEPQRFRRLQPADGTTAQRYHGPLGLELPRQPAPMCYVAGPFSGMTSPEPPDGALLPIQATHGRIQPGEYRRLLLRIDSTLREAGLATLLPHRDVNRWGRKVVSPKEAMLACTRAVEACDLFVGILGGSPGAHYEFGLARGLGKPSLLIECAELESSFLASGVSVLDSPDVLTVSMASAEMVVALLKSQAVRAFIARHVDLPPRPIERSTIQEVSEVKEPEAESGSLVDGGSI